MEDINKALGATVGNLSDENYAHSLAFYRFWLDIGQTYHQIPPGQICDTIWKNRGTGLINPEQGKLIHSTAHLIVRFARDAESDHLLAPCNSGLQSCLSTRTLKEFFSSNLRAGCADGTVSEFYANVNLIAHWANLGYVEEVAIRNHILQSLTSHQKLYDHQADALVILFKLAGATFEAYADPSVFNRCFELLKGHKYYNQRLTRHEANPGDYYGKADDLKYGNSYDLVRREPVQEVVTLRERGWEGLPPPPVFATGKSKLASPNQKDPTPTSVVASLRLPNRKLKPHISRPPPLKLIIIREPDPIPALPVTPATQSLSISISTLSDFTIVDTFDDESPTGATNADTSDKELPIESTAVASHKTFYFEDGNVEVLCGNTLFRVHAVILSFHSPVLRQIFSQNSLATAESPNGCPRILSSDTPNDFTTLLKMIYLPGFPERNKVPDFATFSSLLRITAKYEMLTIRSQLLEAVYGAYPETVEGLASSKSLGESIFSGPTPHPNEVLNLFIQERLTFALPVAYYMAARRGLDSLMNRHLPRNATLSPEVLRSAIGGLMTLRETELNETHRLIFGPKGPRPCSVSNCPSRIPTSPGTLEAYQKVFDHIVGSSPRETKVLEVPEFYEDRGSDVQRVGAGICNGCVERWESGHAELRKRAWAMLPDAFELGTSTHAEKSTSGGNGGDGDIPEFKAAVQGVGPIDESGVDPRDIDLVMQQASCSRAKAVQVLNKSSGDLVYAIIAACE